MVNEVDRCPGTPPFSVVDAVGCVDTADADADGVVDGADACPGSRTSAQVNNNGCNIDQTCPCVRPAKPWAGHSQYLMCVSKRVREFYDQKKMTPKEAGRLLIKLAANLCGDERYKPGS